VRTSLKRLALALVGVSAAAHHSNAPFDMTRSETVSGIVREFRWANPHSYIALETPDGAWRLEMEALNFLVRLGWSKNTVKPGDRIACTGAPPKDSKQRVMKCFLVELPDGRKLVATPTSADDLRRGVRP
jgi:hypothetical protein